MWESETGDDASATGALHGNFVKVYEEDCWEVKVEAHEESNVDWHNTGSDDGGNNDGDTDAQPRAGEDSVLVSQSTGISLIEGSISDVDGDHVSQGAASVTDTIPEFEQDELAEAFTYEDRATVTWTTILTSLFQKWSVPHRTAIANYIFLQRQTVGTMCSGSELVAALLAEAPQHWGEDTQLDSCNFFEHSFSCENEGYKQQWIKDMFAPALLFGDAGEIARGQGTDLMSSETALVPYVDIFIAGFSCKDVSAMNIWKHLWEQRQAEQDGSTAYTLRCGLTYIDVKRPKIFVL